MGLDSRCLVGGGGEGIPDINFVPGTPINLRGGLTAFFQVPLVEVHLGEMDGSR